MTFCFWILGFSKKKIFLFFLNEHHYGFHMRQHLFLHCGRFLQNLEEGFIQTNMHTTVRRFSLNHGNYLDEASPAYFRNVTLNRQRKFVQIKKTSIQQINHYRIIRIFLCMKWYVLLLSIHFKCTYIPIRYIFRVEPQIFDLRIYFWLVGPIKAFRQMTEIFLIVQDLASFSSFLRFKCAPGNIYKNYM